MASAAFFLFLVLPASEALETEVKFVLSHTVDDFDGFVTAYKRTYNRNSIEYHHRRALFEERTAEIGRHNARPDRLWNAGVNHLTDRTDEEFQQLLGRRGPRSGGGGGGSAMKSLIETEARSSLAKSVDWRSNLTSLKKIPDQGACGSCWAVTSSGLLDTRYEIANRRHHTFAAQQLVDCVPNPKACGGTGGCGGATVELAMKYVLEKGLGTNKDVPYVGKDQDCNDGSFLLQGGGVAVGLKSYQTLEENKAEPLMRAIMDGPVAISVGADTWSSYTSGIFDGCEKDAVINHAVLAVGYGTDSEKNVNYWTIRNSWGGGWGEKGFIRLFRNKTVEDNDKHCGTDNKPEEGVACKPYPEKVKVCGMCGMLYDSVATEHEAVKKHVRHARKKEDSGGANDNMADATAPILPGAMTGAIVGAAERTMPALLRRESSGFVFDDEDDSVIGTNDEDAQ